MPLEIMIDTKKPGGAMQLTNFAKIDELEKNCNNTMNCQPQLRY